MTPREAYVGLKSGGEKRPPGPDRRCLGPSLRSVLSVLSAEWNAGQLLS